MYRWLPSVHCSGDPSLTPCKYLPEMCFVFFFSWSGAVQLLENLIEKSVNSAVYEHPPDRCVSDMMCVLFCFVLSGRIQGGRRGVFPAGNWSFCAGVLHLWAVVWVKQGFSRSTFERGHWAIAKDGAPRGAQCSGIKMLLIKGPVYAVQFCGWYLN